MWPRLRAALLAALVPLVVVTAYLWVQHRPTAQDAEEIARAARRERLKIWNTPLDDGRCAITVASFGGKRARLVRAEHGGTIHFAVIEAPVRPNPLDLLRQADWLRAKFGTDETSTLGTYGSAASAMSRAGQLCPARLRCLPGRPGCEAESPALPSPLHMYGPPIADPPFASK